MHLTSCHQMVSHCGAHSVGLPRARICLSLRGSPTVAKPTGGNQRSFLPTALLLRVFHLQSFTCGGFMAKDAVEESRHPDAAADVGAHTYHRAGGCKDATLPACTGENKAKTVVDSTEQAEASRGRHFPLCARKVGATFAMSGKTGQADFCLLKCHICIVLYTHNKIKQCQV